MTMTKEKFTAKDVQSLRQKTGAGMMECKKALEETSGDMPSDTRAELLAADAAARRHVQEMFKC